jgi:prevent-host-death family protein
MALLLSWFYTRRSYVLAGLNFGEQVTRLSALLDRVSRGEKITITRHGVPAAMLVPVEETKSRLTHKEIVEGMRKLRKQIGRGKINLCEMIQEGRRF